MARGATFTQPPFVRDKLGKFGVLLPGINAEFGIGEEVSENRVCY